MHANIDVKVYFKGILASLLGIVLAVLGIAAVGAFSDHFNAYPLYAPIALSQTVGIDLLGAVIPLCAALAAAALFFRQGFSAKRFASGLAVSVILAFLLCRPVEEGVAGLPFLFALLVSGVSAALSVYPKSFSALRRRFLPALLLTLVYVPLSLLAVDLIYSQAFSGSVIGGNGLSDGLLTSTLYAPLCLAAVFSALAYFLQTAKLLGKRGAESPEPNSAYV
ncbi:MAG: hypothetical protein NWE93_11935 [Candidatus Bathyarchaeota archaeon]|nr:hypothetical protein [Candidatus Bathyarchaeota archaeon]